MSRRLPRLFDRRGAGGGSSPPSFWGFPGFYSWGLRRPVNRGWSLEAVSPSASSAEEIRSYSFFKEILLLFALAAFFSLCISFFCLFDLGGVFCTFLCSLFAMIYVPPASIISVGTTKSEGNSHSVSELIRVYIVPDFVEEEIELPFPMLV